MSYARTLQRKLDADLIARLESGIKHAPGAIKKVTPPRQVWSYRAVWRNAMKAVRAENKRRERIREWQAREAA